MMARASVVLPAPSSPLRREEIAAARDERELLAQPQELGLADVFNDVGSRHYIFTSAAGATGR